MQTVRGDDDFTVIIEETADIEKEKAAFIQPFDLYNDRLFRIRLVKDAGHYYLLQDTHHIISDGTSRRVLLADIEKAYRGERLEAEEWSLADVAKAEAEVREMPKFEEDKKWYAEHFDCGDTDSPLLGDIESEPGERLRVGASAGMGLLTRTMSVSIDSVDAFCKEHGIYKSALFTAAYAFLLAKYLGEQEVLFTTIHNGRTDKRLAHAVAMLVRTLPAYAKFTDETTVLDFLKAGQEQMSGCRQHEAYAYSDAVNDLGLRPATTFAWHGTLFDSLLFDGKPMTAQRLNNNTVGTPLYVKAYIRDGHYCVEAEYDASQYSGALIRQFLESYEAVVAGFLATEKLTDIDIATASLGVLKASCAYQPLDPTYPKERLNFMMQDAGTRLLIADEELRPLVDEYQGDVLLTKELTKLPSVTDLPEDPKPGQPVYPALHIWLYGCAQGLPADARQLGKFLPLVSVLL